MNKIEKTIASVPPISGAQQLYLIGTYNPDGTLFIQTQAFVCYIPGPPEGNAVGVVASDQIKNNIMRERAFSLNLCSVDMSLIAESAWRGYAPETGGEKSVGRSMGNKLQVPVLDISPYVAECKVSQSLQVGDTTLFISETVCTHVDCRFARPYPVSENRADIYNWYASQDAKNFNPLLYAFKYYTLYESIGKADIKDW